MQVKVSHPSSTEAELVIIPSSQELSAMKAHVLGHFVDEVKLSGFRAGKAPAALIEKSVDQAELQSRFLEETISQLYEQAVKDNHLKVVAQPEMSIKKFVPFTTLEFEAKVAVIGAIKLPDYTKIKQQRTKVTITSKDVAEVLASLRQRQAEKKPVQRPARSGDEVVIDFSGKDAKGQPIKGADGKDYPLLLGSNAFIPGFEDNIAGLSPGDKKTFALDFPKDYGVKALANKKVTFDVIVQVVNELLEPSLDDAFAATVGPFKTLTELKADIKKQLTLERQKEAEQRDESDLVQKITAKSTVNLPKVLVENTIDSMIKDSKQNLIYRGQTYEEFLQLEGMTDDDYRRELEPQATNRVKAGLVLAEIAEKEHLDVSLEELETRIQLLKGQYQDQAMQAELDKPGNRQDIASRLLTEKVLVKLKSYSLVG